VYFRHCQQQTHCPCRLLLRLTVHPLRVPTSSSIATVFQC